jgi:hypothetical protein
MSNTALVAVVLALFTSTTAAAPKTLWDLDELPLTYKERHIKKVYSLTPHATPEAYETFDDIGVTIDTKVQKGEWVIDKDGRSACTRVQAWRRTRPLARGDQRDHRRRSVSKRRRAP